MRSPTSWWKSRSIGCREKFPTSCATDSNLVARFYRKIFFSFFTFVSINILVNSGFLKIGFQYELIQFDNIWLSYEDQYRWLQADYQIGVFISRSSAGFVTFKRIWLMSLFQVRIENFLTEFSSKFHKYSVPNDLCKFVVLFTYFLRGCPSEIVNECFFQFINVILFLTESLYLYIPNIWIVFALVLWEGLLGGGAYVNTFYKMTEEVRKKAWIFKIKKKRKIKDKMPKKMAEFCTTRKMWKWQKIKSCNDKNKK